MNITQWLDWDSEILGFKVAKLIPSQFSEAQLLACLNELARNDAKLVYWASDSLCATSQQAAHTMKGFLADRKLTYLGMLDIIPDELSQHIVEEYEDDVANEQLIQLAYLSGLYSRFKMDPKISQSQFERIYRLWIGNSVNKQIAYKVLVVKKDGQIVGMVTLGEKQGRGDIGLLAVDPNYHGQRIGSALITAAKKVFAQRYQINQVVTQAANVPACQLYERCGYKVERIENFYHFWL